jgi:hypothetical protein
MPSGWSWWTALWPSGYLVSTVRSHNDRGWSFDDVVDRFTIEVQAGRSGVVDVNDGPAGRMWQCAHWLFPGEGVG